ncbi:MAG: phosphoglycerate kinase [Methylocystaceae bacterium]
MTGLSEARLENKTVLLRVDFNVPLDKSGEIIDDTRIREALPTIDLLRRHNNRVVVVSHLGRPKGKFVPELSLAPVARRLSQLLNTPVELLGDCVGEPIKQAVKNLKPGEVIVLENVRFHAEEEKNDPAFARELAALADVYVNDAFGTAHRAHASTAGVAEYLPCYSGLLVDKEVKMLNLVLANPEKPKMAITGGAKVSDKLGLLRNLIRQVDIVIIGGGMANTFLKAQGFEVGKSLLESGLLEEARNLLAEASSRGVQILLPTDVVVSDHLGADAAAATVAIDQIKPDDMILDIGPRTVELYAQAIKKARSIIWNGPMGVYEYEQFAGGTEGVARAVADSTAISVIGGGDSIATIYKLGLENEVTHISTGGGAALEYLEGLKLPGLVACGCYA